jgi:hypothetical protein
MKKTLILSFIALLIGVIGTYAMLKVVVPQWNRSAVDNTFWETTEKLDHGGEAFAYLHAEKITAAVLQFIAGLEKNLPPAPEAEQAKRTQAFALINGMFKSYGLEEISGLGFSSFTLKPGLHRNRVVIHHRPGRNKGLIWNIAGRAPHDLGEIEMLAHDTALAFVADYDIEKMVNWIGEQGMKMTGQQAGQGLDVVKMGLAAAGIDYDRLLKSYGGRIGFIVTLDPEKRVSLPAGQSQLSLPEPGMAILLKVNDTYLFDLIKGKAVPGGQARFKDEAGVKKIAFSRLPMPIPLEPVIAQKGEWLIAASFVSVADALLDDRSRKLADSDDYKALAYKLPRRGNGFGYVSPMVPRLLAQVLRENKAVFPSADAMEKIAAILVRSKGMCQVWENSASGLVYTVHHGFEVATLGELIGVIVEMAANEKVKSEAAAAPPPAVGELPEK